MFANAEAYEQFTGRRGRLVAPLPLEFANIPNVWGGLDVD
jgi:hypothetical protein